MELFNGMTTADAIAAMGGIISEGKARERLCNAGWVECGQWKKGEPTMWVYSPGYRKKMEEEEE